MRPITVVVAAVASVGLAAGMLALPAAPAPVSSEANPAPLPASVPRGQAKPETWTPPQHGPLPQVEAKPVGVEYRAVPGWGCNVGLIVSNVTDRTISVYGRAEVALAGLGSEVTPFAAEYIPPHGAKAVDLYTPHRCYEQTHPVRVVVHETACRADGVYYAECNNIVATPRPDGRFPVPVTAARW